MEPPVITQTSEAPQQVIASNDTKDRGADSHAQIDDAGAVPVLNEAGRQHYKEFLSHASPRAFVICQNGSFTTIFGSNQFVTQQLKSRAGGCEPYVVNDEVVWKK
jgi:hypothetical protein